MCLVWHRTSSDDLSSTRTGSTEFIDLTDCTGSIVRGTRRGESVTGGSRVKHSPKQCEDEATGQIAGDCGDGYGSLSDELARNY